MTTYKVYTWAPDTTGKGVIPLIWCEPFKHYGNAPDKDPYAAADRVAPLLKARPVGERVLFLNFPVPAPDFDNVPLRLCRDFFRPDALAWYERFFWELHAAGADIDLIVLDEEKGYTNWHFGDAAERIFRSVYADASAAKALPANLRAFKPDDYLWVGDKMWNREAIIAWNRFADLLYQEMLDRTIDDAAGAILGGDVRFCNYGTMKLSASVPIELNGWPLFSNATTSISSPSLYPDSPEALEWCLRVAKSVKAAGGTLMPWVPFPSFVKDVGRLRTLITALKKHGVKEFLYWGPRPESTPEDDALLIEMING